MPHIAKMHRELEDDGLVVLGVSLSERSREAPIEYMESHGYDYTLLLDGELVANRYEVTGIPAIFLIGPDGVILKTYGGYSAAREPEMERAVRDALGLE